MSRFGKRPAEGALKAARKRVDAALERVESEGPLEARVHDARRYLKKARAWLRLLRAALPKKERRRLNELCREAGQALAPARDGAALERAWQDLELDGPGGGLLLQRRLAAERGVQEGAALRACGRALRKARRRVREASLDGAGWDAVGEGLEAACLRLDAALQEAQRSRTDAAFHEWRKRAKDLRYQLELLAHPSHRSVGRVVTLLKELTDLLGDDHDLAGLAAVVAGAPDDFGGARAASRIEAAIMRKRRALRRAALALARRWTPDKPALLAARARESWKRASNLKE